MPQSSTTTSSPSTATSRANAMAQSSSFSGTPGATVTSGGVTQTVVSNPSGGTSVVTSSPSKPTDASFTSQGSTYDSATNSLNQTKSQVSNIPAQQLPGIQSSALTKNNALAYGSSLGSYQGGNAFSNAKSYPTQPKGNVVSGPKDYGSTSPIIPQESFKQRLSTSGEQLSRGELFPAIGTLFNYNIGTSLYSKPFGNTDTKSTIIGYGMTPEQKSVSYPQRTYGSEYKITGVQELTPFKVTKTGEAVSAGLLTVGALTQPEIFLPAITIGGASQMVGSRSSADTKAGQLFNFGGGALAFTSGGMGTIELARNAVTTEQIANAFKAPEFKVGFMKQTDEGTLITQRAYSHIDDIERFSTQTTLIKPTEFGFMQSGELSQTARFSEIGTGKDIIVSSTSQYGGVGKSFPEMNGITPSIAYGKSFKTSDAFIKSNQFGGIENGFKGTFNLYKSSPKSESFTSGITKQVGDFTLTSSGDINKIDFGTYPSQNVISSPTGTTRNIQFGNTKVYSDITGTSLLKNYKAPEYFDIKTPSTTSSSKPFNPGNLPSTQVTTQSTKSSFTSPSFPAPTKSLASQLSVNMPKTTQFSTGMQFTPTTQTKTKTNTINIQGFSSYTPYKTKTSTMQIQNYNLDTIQKPNTQQKFRVTTGTSTSTNTQQITKLNTPLISVPTPSFGGGSSVIPKFDIPIPMITPFNFGGGSDITPAKKVIKGKRRYAYTPSFEALVFGIKGKAPKGTETGARIRPITKGFSWSKLFGGKKK